MTPEALVDRLLEQPPRIRVREGALALHEGGKLRRAAMRDAYADGSLLREGS